MTATETALFYLRLGFDDTDVRAGVVAQHPDCNLDLVMNEATTTFQQEEDTTHDDATQRRIDLGEFNA